MEGGVGERPEIGLLGVLSGVAGTLGDIDPFLKVKAGEKYCCFISKNGTQPYIEP